MIWKNYWVRHAQYEVKFYFLKNIILFVNNILKNPCWCTHAHIRSIDVFLTICDFTLEENEVSGGTASDVVNLDHVMLEIEPVLVRDQRPND